MLSFMFFQFYHVITYEMLNEFHHDLIIFETDPSTFHWLFSKIYRSKSLDFSLTAGCALLIQTERGRHNWNTISALLLNVIQFHTIELPCNYRKIRNKFCLQSDCNWYWSTSYFWTISLNHFRRLSRIRSYVQILIDYFSFAWSRSSLNFGSTTWHRTIWKQIMPFCSPFTQNCVWIIV